MTQLPLWKYCSSEQCKDMLLSMELLDRTVWPDDKYLACLYSFANHTDEHYRSTKVRKRDGSMRQLYEPDPLLKWIQRNILHHVLEQLPVSSYATAYRKGSGIKANADLHKGKEVVLKLDIKNFFDHVMFHMVFQHAFPSIYFPDSVRGLLTHLCCRRECLPQGAPASAYISNLVLKPFDEYMGPWCQEQGITYSRYCDDITCSGSFNPYPVIRKITAFLQAMGFCLNERKTRIMKQSQSQIVTGIVVNDTIQVPGTYRDEVRKELYYCRKYGVISHLAFTGGETYLSGPAGTQKYLRSLLGRIRYILHINHDDAFFLEGEDWVKKQLQDYAEIK